jgi:hypothetical protein
MMELVEQYAPVSVQLFTMPHNEQNLFIFKTSTIIRTHVRWFVVRVMGTIVYVKCVV